MMKAGNRSFTLGVLPVADIKSFLASHAGFGRNARRTGTSRGAGNPAADRILIRVIVTVRLCVVASVALLLLFGSVPAHGPLLLLAWIVVALGCVHGLLVCTHPAWEQRGSKAVGPITVADWVLATAAFAVTGASHGPVIAALVLAVVAAAIRLKPRHVIPAGLVLATVVFVLSIVIGPWNPLAERLRFALWWSAYLILILIVTVSLSLLAERRQDAAISANAEALLERRAAEEERDLRDRLMASYQAQYDGLRIILHEFRTPVISLRALAASLGRDSPALSADARSEAATLLLSHAEHLSEMLDGLADVARLEGSPLGVSQRRKTKLAPLLLAAADAGGLRPPRLLLRVEPPGATAIVEVSRLRRIVTNLADNAVKHASPGAVYVDARLREHALELIFRDHGPGLPPEQRGNFPRKHLSSRGSGETSGLGLWIVDQLVQSLGGELWFTGREEEGLDVRVSVPV
jgi:signal transduction histidine kinase